VRTTIKEIQRNESILLMQWSAAEIEQLVAALTRRRFLAAASAVSGLVSSQSAYARQATPVAEWTFTDDRGKTITLPKTPERIVMFIDCAAALWPFGVRPLAVFGPLKNADGTPAARLGDVDATTVIDINAGDVIDIEKLVEVQPDLIITNMWIGDSLNLSSVTGDGAEQIQAVAPVLGISMTNRTVNDIVTRYGELAAALGFAGDSETLVAAKADYDAACDRVRTAAAAKPDLRLIFGIPAVDQLFIADPTQWPDVALLVDLGVNVVVPDEVHDVSPFYAVSWERFGLYPADVFMSSIPTDGLEAGPVWEQYPAVAAGQVFGWGPEPYWLVFTYQNYVSVLNYVADILATANVVS
jgi:iron complex transport system substrate-binding protein